MIPWLSPPPLPPSPLRLRLPRGSATECHLCPSHLFSLTRGEDSEIVYTRLLMYSQTGLPIMRAHRTYAWHTYTSNTTLHTPLHATHKPHTHTHTHTHTYTQYQQEVVAAAERDKKVIMSEPNAIIRVAMYVSDRSPG